MIATGGYRKLIRDNLLVEWKWWDTRIAVLQLYERPVEIKCMCEGVCYFTSTFHWTHSHQKGHIYV